MNLCNCDIISAGSGPEIRLEALEDGAVHRETSTDNQNEAAGDSNPGVGVECPIEEEDLQGKSVNPIRMHRRNCYETTVRIRMTFYVFLSMAICQSAALSFITHMLFSIMADLMDAHPMQGASLLLQILILPLLLVLYAVITDSVVDVGLDGMKTPSMSQWKASVTLLAGDCFPSFSTRKAEIGFLLVFEGLPVLSMVYGFLSVFNVFVSTNTAGKPTSPTYKVIGIIHHFFQGGVLAVFLIVIVFLIARLYVQSCERWEEDLAELYHSSVPLGHLNRHTAKRATIAGACSRFRPFSKHDSCLRCFAYLGIAALLDLLVLLIFMFRRNVDVFLVGHFLVMIIVVCYLKSTFPLLVGRTFWVALTSSYVVTFGLLSAANRREVPRPLAPLCLGPPHPGYNQSGYDLPLDFTPPGNSQRDGYSVCSKRWGHWRMTEANQFAVLDLAALAYVSAYRTQAEIRDNLHVTFGGTALGTWNLTHVEPSEEIGRWIAVDFPMQKTRVIAVRGTSTIAGVYVDLAIITGIAVFQVMNLWTPVLNTVGGKWLMWIINTAKPRFWDRFMDAVEREHRAAIASGSALVLTGHGLGAALAGVGAARSGVQCLGFSAPGIYYQAYRLGADLEALRRVFSDIQPFDDSVTRDHRYGSVSWVKCESAAGCHKLTTTACELWSQCGDPRARDFRQTCKKQLTKADLNDR